MMFHCLSSSLTADAYAKVVTEDHQYTHQVDNYPVHDGPCFLKVIVDSAYINTRSSSAVIRTNLSNLDKYMESVKDSNIETFNHYVKENVKQLAAAGETTSDLLVNLFKAYRCVKDKAFVAWVANKRSSWYEGTLVLEANGNELMELAESYYKDAIATSEWLKLSDDEQKIVALEAEIQDLRKGKKFYRKDTGRPQPRKTGKQDKWAWKKVPPKSGASNNRQFQKKTYYWCPQHKLWCLHKPEDCRLGQEEKNQPSTETKSDAKPTLQRQALATLIEVQEGDNNDGYGH